MNSRTALITGAGSGIGRALTRRLVCQGYDCVAVGRTREPLDDLARDLGNRVRPVPADVSDAEGLAAALADTGPVHALVANAGVCLQTPLDADDADEVWRQVLSINLDGVWNTFRAVRGAISEGGRAVAVSSGLGKLGRGGYAAYAASKHGVLGLIKCLAKELAPRRITVNAVCPGWVATEMAEADLVRTARRDGSDPETVRAAALVGIPLGRFAEADEVVALINWLLTDDAAAITGQAYNISCGEFFA